MLVALVMFLTIGAVFADEPKDEIAKLSKAYDLAIKTRDEKALDKLIDDDSRFITDDGRLLDKKGHIAKISGRTYETSASEDVTIRIVGDLAIETATWTGKGKMDGNPFQKQNRYTTIWVKKGFAWVVISAQSTPITTNR
jgi:ketosteroid isomerase-like protein